MRARVRKVAGPLKPSTTALDVQGNVTQDEAGEFHLRLVIHAGDGTGERNIDGKSCKALVGAAAVTLALLLHSETPLTESALGQSTTSSDSTKSSSSTSQQTASTTPPPTTKPVSEEPPKATKSEKPPRRWRILLQAPSGALGVGPLREVSYGLSAAAGLSFDRWRFLARGTGWFTQELSRSSVDLTYGADIHRMTGSLLACRAIPLSPFEIAPCLSLSLERLSAQGKGSYIATKKEQATWLALGIAGDARVYATSWLSFVLGIRAELQTARPELSLSDVGPVETLLPIAATVTLGPEWIL